jgi:DNA-binding transcriptional MerR regulator
METYDIKDLEELSNIKAHTIRIWEKRYGLLKPTRTSTNIRKYDSNQLKKLLNITLLLNKGFKISEVAKMDDNKIFEEILNEKTNQQFNHEDQLSNELIDSMMNFDTARFEKTLNTTILRYGLVNAILKVVYPFLRKTGVLWSTDNIMPAQEHLVVNIIRQKMIVAIDGLTLSPTNEKEFILFLPPNEYHEIGLLLSHYIVLKYGYPCYYLGQNIPLDNVASTIARVKKPVLLTFLAERNYNETVSSFLTEYQDTEMILVITDTLGSLLKQNKLHHFIKDAQELIKCL